MENLLSVSQLAERLALDEETIRRLTRSGELPHLRIGKSIRYRPSDIIGYENGLNEMELIKAGLGVSSTGAYPAFLEAIAMSLGYPNSPVCDTLKQICHSLERIACALESRK